MFDTALLVSWLAGLPAWGIVLFAIAFVDFATGALLAWNEGTFSWERAPGFLKTWVIFLGAWLAAEVMAIIPGAVRLEIPTYFDTLADVAPKAVFVAIVVSKYAVSVVDNIQAILKLRRENAARAEWDAALLERINDHDDIKG